MKLKLNHSYSKMAYEGRINEIQAELDGNAKVVNLLKVWAAYQKKPTNEKLKARLERYLANCELMLRWKRLAGEWKAKGVNERYVKNTKKFNVAKRRIEQLDVSSAPPKKLKDAISCVSLFLDTYTGAPKNNDVHNVAKCKTQTTHMRKMLQYAFIEHFNTPSDKLDKLWELMGPIENCTDNTTTFDMAPVKKVYREIIRHLRSYACEKCNKKRLLAPLPDRRVCDACFSDNVPSKKAERYEYYMNHLAADDSSSTGDSSSNEDESEVEIETSPSPVHLQTFEQRLLDYLIDRSDERREELLQMWHKRDVDQLERVMSNTVTWSVRIYDGTQAISKTRVFDTREAAERHGSEHALVLNEPFHHETPKYHYEVKETSSAAQ